MTNRARPDGARRRSAGNGTRERMGKGDIRTRRGKINRGTYGVRRRRKRRQSGAGDGNRR